MSSFINNTDNIIIGNSNNNNNDTSNDANTNKNTSSANNIMDVTNDLKNAILSVLLDQTNESYNKLEELSSLQLQCISELQGN